MAADPLDNDFRRRIESAMRTVADWEDPDLLRECRESIPLDILCAGPGMPKLRLDKNETTEKEDESSATNTSNGTVAVTIEDADTASKDDFSKYVDDSKDTRWWNAPNALLLQRLARYFKQTMTWVNAPACVECQTTDNMNLTTTRAGGTTDDERRYKVSRVEDYQCSSCYNTTSFCRYNDTGKLLQTKQGRCGEYANLFGAICRSMGWEVRYIMDVTDHVWTEVWLEDLQEWVMVDSCEGVVAETSMYEHGWQKKLSYIVAVSIDHVVDVTPRYTRQWQSDDFQARRRGITSSESAGQAIVRSCHEQQQRKYADKKHKARLDDLNNRLERECKELRSMQYMTEWTQKYKIGRISGSLTWKLSRDEAGMMPNGSGSGIGSGSDNVSNVDGNKEIGDRVEKKDEELQAEKFEYESFYPRSNRVWLRVQPPNDYAPHSGITVSGVECAVTSGSSAMNVVVVDHECLGAILLSRAFTSCDSLVQFLKRLPLHRIVLMQGRVTKGSVDDSKRLAEILGGFKADVTLSQGVMFVGQVGICPSWTVCSSFVEGKNGPVVEATVSDPSNQQRFALQTIPSTHPVRVIGRIPEQLMPMATQLMATHEQKRKAFLSYFQSDTSKGTATVSHVYGYTTKSGAPIYLLDSSAYPLETIASDEGSNDEDSRYTFVMQAEPLVAKDDVGVVDKPTKTSETSFEIPLEASAFTGQVGTQLLVKNNGAASTTDTAAALYNKRLVGLYFSAHWCGPCRSFTPLLAEMYEHLKEARRSHGLEIIFVSSDRDAMSFQNYYRSMPWCAIPFESLPMYKDMLSMQYQVQGIPSLIILDALSGQVVVDGRTSRGEVMQACQRGDAAVESLFDSWLTRVPQDTKDILEMLKLSCVDHSSNDKSASTNESAMEEYCFRKQESTAKSGEAVDVKVRVKEEIARLVKEGMNPNQAAAKAIALASSLETCSISDAGPLDRFFVKSQQADFMPSLADYVKSMPAPDAKLVLNTVLLYYDNVIKTPWDPKLRRFKLSNKVADRITSTTNGLDMLACLGWKVCFSQSDYYAILPATTDVDASRAAVQITLAKMDV
jgi:thiol-disulfide isomerase/thioredoxin